MVLATTHENGKSEAGRECSFVFTRRALALDPHVLYVGRKPRDSKITYKRNHKLWYGRRSKKIILENCIDFHQSDVWRADRYTSVKREAQNWSESWIRHFGLQAGEKKALKTAWELLRQRRRFRESVAAKTKPLESDPDARICIGAKHEQDTSFEKN